MNNKPKLQERIFQAANIQHSTFRTSYKALKQMYIDHPEKLKKL